MKKTNRELNEQHDKRVQERVRPKGAAYDFAPLTAVVNQWVRERLSTQA